jgi:hypothetical protein
MPSWENLYIQYGLHQISRHAEVSVCLNQGWSHFIHNTMALEYWRCKAAVQVFWSPDWSGFNRTSRAITSSTGLSELQPMKANKYALYWHWPELSCLLNCCNRSRKLGKAVRNVACPPSGVNLLTATLFYRFANVAIPLRQTIDS